MGRPVETYKQLDDRARTFLDGEFNTMQLFGLGLFDQVAVLMKATSYSLCKLGVISSRLCAKIELGIWNEYRRLKTSAYFFEKAYRSWLGNKKKYAAKMTELSKALASESSSPQDIMRIQSEIIDALTQDNIYLTMTEKRLNDPEFKAKCYAILRSEGGEWLHNRGIDIKPHTQVQMLEAFFRATCEDGTAAMFEQLDPDYNLNRAVSGKVQVPVKKDACECKGIAESMDRLSDTEYERQRRSA